MLTSAIGEIALMETSTSVPTSPCYSTFGNLNAGSDAIAGTFIINLVTAYTQIIDAPLGTGGTYNMTTATITITVGTCTYVLRLNPQQQISSSFTLKIDSTQQIGTNTSSPDSTQQIGTNTSSPGLVPSTTSTISSSKTSAARALSPPAILLLAALTGLTLILPVRV
jgi:hypothetical protein